MKDMKVTDKRCMDLSLVILKGIPGIRFDMHKFRERCGTAGCIGGYAVATYARGVWESKKKRGGLASCANDIELVAAKLLGLNQTQAGEMFYPWVSNGLVQRKEYTPGASDITPEMAARMLTHFVATKKIVWKHQS